MRVYFDCSPAWRALSLALRAADNKIATESPALPDGLYARSPPRAAALTAELFFQKVPLTVANFTGLAEGTLGPRAEETLLQRPHLPSLRRARLCRAGRRPARHRRGWARL